MKAFPSLSLLLLILIMVISLQAGVTMKENGLEDNETLTNVLETRFTHNLSFPLNNITEEDMSSDIITKRINNVIYKIFDAVTYTTFEVSKIFIEVGYHQSEDFNMPAVLNTLLIIIIILSIGIFFYPAAIISFFIYKGIKIIFKQVNKQWKQKVQSNHKK